MKRILCLIAAIVVGGAGSAGAGGRDGLPGFREKGEALLPNGWRIAPVGRQLPLGDLPLEMVESPDGHHLVVTNDGYSHPVLSVVDLERETLRRVRVDGAWLGLAWAPDGKHLYASGGGTGKINELSFEWGSLKPAGSIELPRNVKDGFVGGLSVSPDGSRLFVVQIFDDSLSEVDLRTRKAIRTVPLPAEPYTTLLSADGRTVFVSLWGGARVLVFDAGTLSLERAIPVGEHPNAMALSPDGSRLFVACANSNAVWVVDVGKGTALEQVRVSLYPQAPEGSTPNGLGLSPDGKTLLVANADNNAVAVVDVSEPGASQVKGFIPTGWYPTAARFSRDGRRIFVLSGKGLSSTANPRGPAEPNYIGQLLLGSLSVLDLPNPETLAAYTRTVYSLTPYSDATRLSPADAPEGSPIPGKVGGPSPIKHVFYILRENRSYDQVLGDLDRGNGDPNLCLFGEEVTPNAHALAREFVTLDNFYVDAEVSADGHAFSFGAYAPDFIEKTWPMNYADRGGRYVTEGQGERRTAYGNVAAPARGYIWDAARRAGVSLRDYGIFAHREPADAHEGPQRVVASVPGLEGLVNPDYTPWDLTVTDNHRADVWLQEFRQFERDGNLPQLSLIYLPNDHTFGTRAGEPTPRAMVAENDKALGRVVEAISKSRYWKDSAIFVLEDDAQNGPDHVDAHRSVALVASPYARRGSVVSTLFTTSGMLRTLELILGIPPMSQYDAAATPFYDAFQADPVLTPYEARPPRISIDERNAPGAPGAKASAALDLDQPDRAPMRLLNEILWKAVRGADSLPPPPVRAAFVRPLPDDEEAAEPR